MPSLTVRKLITLLNGYPEWAKDKITRNKIDLIAGRLVELALHYQCGMHDKRTANSHAMELLNQLFISLHQQHPETYGKAIDSYHISREFMSLLELADLIRTRRYISPKSLTKSFNDIKRIKAANSSRQSQLVVHQQIIQAANRLLQPTPQSKPNRSLKTASIARILTKQFPRYSVGTIRNLLTPLNKKIN